MKIIFRILLFTILVSSQTNLKAQQWINTLGPITGKITAITSNGSDIYVSSLGVTVFFSNDNGSYWKQLYNGFISPYIEDVINYKNEMYCSVNAIYKLDNTDSTWKIIHSCPHNWFTSLETKNNIFLAATYSDGIYISTTGGGNWSNISTGLFSGTYGIVPINDLAIISDSFFVTATKSGVYYTKNQGANWQKAVSTMHECYDLQIVNNKIYLSASDNTYISYDSGQTWQKENFGFNLYRILISSMAFYDGLFCASTAAEVLYSYDSGASINVDTSRGGFISLYITDSTIWAGTQKGIVFKRSRYGITSVIPKKPKIDEIKFDTWNKEITINSNIEVLDYNLISMNGKRLKAQINKINTHKYSINQNLPTGVYIIQFFSENKILTEKIFIH